MPESAQQPGDERPPPTNFAELFDLIMDRNGYENLHRLADHTSIPYKTLWSWKDGTRSAVRSPAASVLRKFAADMGMPEALVFKAAGRSYTDPGALDDGALQLVSEYKGLPEKEQKRLLRIVAAFTAMTASRRPIAEAVVRAVASAD